MPKRPPLTPEQRILRARIAAHESWRQTADPAARTANARQALRDRFLLEVDPDGVLDPKERARRAEHARKAHYARLALASSRARAARKAELARPAEIARLQAEHARQAEGARREFKSSRAAGDADPTGTDG